MGGGGARVVSFCQRSIAPMFGRRKAWAQSTCQTWLCPPYARLVFFFGCVCLFLGGTSTFIFNCKQARIFFGRASFRGFRQYRKARWRGVLGISSLNNKSVDIDARNPLQSTESARKGRHACIIYAFICAASASMSACILAKCASRSPAQRTTRCRTVSSAFVFIVFHLCPMQTV